MNDLCGGGSPSVPYTHLGLRLVPKVAKRILEGLSTRRHSPLSTRSPLSSSLAPRGQRLCRCGYATPKEGEGNE